MRPKLNISIQRLLAIDDLVRSGRFPTQDELASRLEVSRRTVQRDFDFLRDQGAPLKYDSFRKGFCYADPAYRLSFLKVSAQELLAVFLSQRLLALYGDTPFAQGIASLFERCLPMLPGEIRVDPEQLRQNLAVRVAPVAHADASMFAKVSNAVLEHLQIKMVYWTAERGTMSQRVLDPYALAYVQGN